MKHRFQSSIAQPASHWFLVCAITTVLLTAALYALVREYPPSLIHDLKPLLHISSGYTAYLPSVLTGSLPSFSHLLLMLFCTFLLFRDQRLQCFTGYAGCFVISIGMELVQHPACQSFVELINELSGTAGILLQPLADYGRRGTFDHADLAAIGIAMITGLIMSGLFRKSPTHTGSFAC